MFTRADAEDALKLISETESEINRAVIKKTMSGLESLRHYSACEEARIRVNNKLAGTRLMLQDRDKMQRDPRWIWVIIKKTGWIMKRASRVWRDTTEQEIAKLKASGCTIVYIRARKREEGVNLLEMQPDRMAATAQEFEPAKLEEFLTTKENGKLAQELGYMVRYCPTGLDTDETAIIMGFDLEHLDLLAKTPEESTI